MPKIPFNKISRLTPWKQNKPTAFPKFLKMKCKMVARVAFDYQAQDEGELSIKEGGILLITDDTDQDWWEAYERPLDTFEEGRKGLIPLTYVEEVSGIR